MLSQYLKVSPKPVSFQEYLASKVAHIQSKRTPFLEELLYWQIVKKSLDSMDNTTKKRVVDTQTSEVMEDLFASNRTYQKA